MWDFHWIVMLYADFQRLVKDVDFDWSMVTGAVRYGDVMRIQFPKEYKDKMMELLRKYSQPLEKPLDK